MHGEAAVGDRYPSKQVRSFYMEWKIRGTSISQLFLNSSHLEALKEEGNEKKRGREGGKYLVTVSVLLDRGDLGFFTS
jgi:hypothetical protein